MPLSALRADGTFPPGVYQASLDEVFATFPTTTQKRVVLHNALAFCVATVERLALADQIALDGSYLTNKPDPGDVDLTVLTPGIYQLAGEQRFTAEGINLQLLDIQFAHDLVDFQGWITFFSTVCDGTSKGVVTVTY
jgi:uncharacterized protein DUF6932